MPCPSAPAKSAIIGALFAGAAILLFVRPSVVRAVTDTVLPHPRRSRNRPWLILRCPATALRLTPPSASPGAEFFSADIAASVRRGLNTRRSLICPSAPGHGREIAQLVHTLAMNGIVEPSEYGIEGWES